MKTETAVVRLAALAQASRLSLFRLLVRKGPDGMSAGEIAERLGIASSTLSFHLKELSNAGLLKSQQDGRFIYYAPDFKAMNDLLGFLTDKCCADGSSDPACAKAALCQQK